ncbi:MAG: DUF4924 family protein [Bacteroidales bacterium]
MIIAKQKRKENIAEYILYMWQLEDILRALNFDLQKIEELIISRYSRELYSHAEIRQWYKDMIEAMYAEGIRDKGHLMHTNYIIQDLSDLNIRILQENSDKEYKELFYKILPAISEIIQNSRGEIKNEIHACFTALYVKLLYRLEKKEINPVAQDSMNSISNLISRLAFKYHECEKEEL